MEDFKGEGKPEQKKILGTPEKSGRLSFMY
jgi:hypothetical protein